MQFSKKKYNFFLRLIVLQKYIQPLFFAENCRSAGIISISFMKQQKVSPITKRKKHEGQNTNSGSFVCGCRKPYIPELSPHNLIEALKNHNPAEPKEAVKQQPLTRQEVAKLLRISLNTVNRYLNQGKLQRVQLSSHAVRISPESVDTLLNNQK